MSFNVSGTIDGQPASVHWDDGQISGDAFAVAAVRRVIEEGRSIGWTPTGPFDKPGLDPAQRAMLTITEGFDHSYVLTGDVPEPPVLPPLVPGAVY